MQCFIFKHIFYYASILVYTVASVLTTDDKVLFYFSPTRENMNEEFFSSTVTNDMTFYMFLLRQTVYYVKYGVPTLRTSTDGKKIGCPKLQKGFQFTEQGQDVCKDQ